MKTMGVEENFEPQKFLYAPFFELESRDPLIFFTASSRGWFFKLGLIAAIDLIILMNSFVLLGASINH